MNYTFSLCVDRASSYSCGITTKGILTVDLADGGGGIPEGAAFTYFF